MTKGKASGTRYYRIKRPHFSKDMVLYPAGSIVGIEDEKDKGRDWEEVDAAGEFMAPPRFPTDLDLASDEPKTMSEASSARTVRKAADRS